MSNRYGFDWSEHAAGATPGGSSDAPLTVTQAVMQAKGALEGIVVRIVGEVSELSNKRGYKAVYFTVKDASSALPCMMWNNRFRAAGVEMRVGSLVEITGRFTLYAAKGRMNFDVFSLKLAGEGDLRLKVANLAKKLAGEGLMDPARKRAVPPFSYRIGLVTSPRGAAVHDVLRTLRRRFPVAQVLFAGVPVEGANAPAGLIEGLRCVVSHGAQVVLLVRGGGSFEDLMPFNDESLARAIAACPVPVVTGIGHEPDTSIADMVADVRASTPTAAAETVSPARDALERTFHMRGRALASAASRSLDAARAALDRRADRAVFRVPEALLSERAQTLDWAEERLARAIPANIERDRAHVRELAGALLRAPREPLARNLRELDAKQDRLERALPARLERTADALAARRQALVRTGGSLVASFEAPMSMRALRLDDLSPLSVLARGYAIARSDDGAIVRSVVQAKPGDRINVSVSDGAFACRIEEANASSTSSGKE